ncbi:MAG: GNAT family N-acetyltransferase [Candidatus Gastranaerophilales bacterium]|nr:GNAT family N-acetyltransferase [Candidatus Gastranaerophilales bacterium]
MYTIEKINKDNIQELEFAYNDFLLRAFSDYGFEILPLEFEDIKTFIEEGILNVIALFEKNILKSFLIYNIVVDVVEVTIVHNIADEDTINRKMALMKALLDEVEGKGYKTVSYTMMGSQKDFLMYIAKLGFDFVGQAVVKFEFDNQASLNIFMRVKDRPTPEGFEVVNFDMKYAKDIINIIHKSFANMNDQKFDPRFKTMEGCEDILAKIVQNIYGQFLPNHAKILLQNGVPKGFCMVNLTTENIANIPLVGILPELKYKGMGQLLLTHALRDVLKSVFSGELPLLELNATIDTENIPAINMYRKLGFKESASYPQAYRSLES